VLMSSILIVAFGVLWLGKDKLTTLDLHKVEIRNVEVDNAEGHDGGQAILPEVKAAFTQSKGANVFLPPPLDIESSDKLTYLSREGILSFTNKQRDALGLTRLSANAQLSEVAHQKLKDMFARKYFDHIAPDGTRLEDLVSQTKYSYLIAGENLAKGNFENDKLLVEAWMKSPGHRANIVHPHYQEIGIAVGQGEFEGRQQWLAVQTFASPESMCVQASEKLLKEIEEKQSSVEKMTSDLQIRNSDLTSLQSYQVREYEMLAGEYNALAGETNEAIQQLRFLVGQYNSQLHDRNECVRQIALPIAELREGRF